MPMHPLVKCFLLLLPLMAGVGCKTNKAIKGPAPSDLTAAKLLDHLIRHQVQAEWLEAKARISFDGDDQSGSASASIIMRKDSLIWMSVRKLGFEVARLQISRDSVYYINRLTNEYSIKDLDHLARTYSLPANLKTVQAIFLGNPVFFNTRQLQLGRDEQNYHLTSTSDHLKNQFWLDAASLSLKRVLYGDQRQRREIDLLLEDYRQVDAAQNFSYLRRIKVNNGELGQAAIEIDFSDVKINSPQEIRFSIPPRYTRID